MASVYKYKNSKYWIAAFRDDQQKRKNRSTKVLNLERHKKQAERIAEEFESVARKQKGALHVKETLSQLLRDSGLSSGEELLSCSVKEYCEKFIEIKASEKGSSTVSSYSVSFRNLCDFLGDRANSPLEGISTLDLKLFRKHLISNYAGKTVSRKLKAVKSMFTEAHADGYNLVNPAHKLDVSNPDANNTGSNTKRPFTIDEIKLLIQNATEEWRSMIYFGLYTGQRLGDLATLRWSNLDLQNRLFRISTNKTGKIIKIPFSETLENHILTLDAPDDPQAYVHPVLGEQYSKKGSNAISNQFGRLLADCGLREPVSHDNKGKGREGRREVKGVGFHNLRVTAITLLHEAGIPQATVQDWVGHESEDVHRLYVKMGDEQSQKASNALPKI